jgi:hypothetical protein
VKKPIDFGGQGTYLLTPDMIMNGMPMAADFRRPVPAGWGFFVLALFPLAIFFPLLIWPLLLSVALFLGGSPARTVFAAAGARPGRAARGSSSFRAPPRF